MVNLEEKRSRGVSKRKDWGKKRNVRAALWYKTVKLNVCVNFGSHEQRDGLQNLIVSQLMECQVLFA